MKLNQIKGILQKLKVIKDYAAIAVPIIIAVIAVVMFIPTTVLQRNLAGSVQKNSAEKLNIINSLRDVPSERQPLEEMKKEAALKSDANSIALMTNKSSKRELIAFGIFPRPAEVSQQVFNRFAKNWSSKYESWMQVLKARGGPTSAELSNSLKKNVVAEEIENATSFSTTEKLIIDDLCDKIARETGVYYEATALAMYRFWGKYAYTEFETAIEDCWYGQLGYWIIEDCLQTVKVMNKGATNVLEANVKRIMDVGFGAQETATNDYSMIRNMQATMMTVKDMPKYVTSMDSGLAMPLSARICDTKIDVVHFRIAVVVKAREAGTFMEELCRSKEHKFRGFNNEMEKEETYRHNQITILKCNMGAVNVEDKEHRLYRYGDEATVKLELLCEYVFDKDGYDEIKPGSVKAKLEGLLQKAAL